MGEMSLDGGRRGKRGVVEGQERGGGGKQERVAGPVVGRCEQMCPEEEKRMRIRERLLHR